MPAQNGGVAEALERRQFYEKMIKDRGANAVLVEIAVAQESLRGDLRTLRAQGTGTAGRWSGRGGSLWAIVEIVGILVAASVVSVLSTRLPF